MNVYDFDFTIYGGDCTFDFIRFCTRRRPALVRYLPGQLFAMLRYTLTKRFVREQRYGVYRFLAALPDTRREVDAFWDAHIDRVYPFYLARRQPDDVVVSASPAFLVAPACARLGVGGVIASDVNPATGESTGVNCFGEEKVRRFLAACPGAVVEEFYSDSLSDAPMASLAQRSFLVRRGRVGGWPDRH